MLTLILGGARSGKSDLGERLARASGRDVLFVATMQRGDDEMRARIEAHRASRQDAWRTVEEPREVLGALRRHTRPGGFALLDCVTLWVSNLLLARIDDIDRIAPEDAAAALDDVVSRAVALAAWSAGYDGEVVAISNEVGLGLVPPYPLGRIFRDALGAANRTLASRAACVYCTVAGLALDVKALGARPIETFEETR
jgi:adenosylcobinamide kinase/adenosylcobinamide-phosphate guanylyltransferase